VIRRKELYSSQALATVNSTRMKQPCKESAMFDMKNLSKLKVLDEQSPKAMNRSSPARAISAAPTRPARCASRPASS